MKDFKSKNKDGSIEVIDHGIFNLRVCTTKTTEEVTTWLERNHPSGTSGGWMLSDRKKCGPVKCADNSERTHLLFDC